MLQQQQQESQQQQQQQLIFDNPHGGQGLGSGDMQQFHSPQHVPQSPHLPTSPQYTNPHNVPQSPQVPQSPLMQRQSSVEPLQSPGPEYSNPGMSGLQDMNLVQRFGNHGVQDYGGMQGSGDGALLHNIQSQIQMQPQNIHIANLQQNDTMSMQNAQIVSLHNHSIPSSASIDMNNSIQQQMAYSNQSVNLQQNQNSFQSQLSGQFHVGGDLGQTVAGPAIADTELVSQIITSLENLRDAQPSAMQEMPKMDTGLQQLTDRVYTSDNSRQFHHQAMSQENGMNNVFNEFAHNTVVHNQGVTSTYNNSQFVSQPQVTESRDNVKKELLKHLASKPLSPRAAQGQFPFQNNMNTSSNNSNVSGNPSQRQRHHSAKAELNPHSSVSKVHEPNSELKRRLSAGPEDIRSPLQTFASAPDISSKTFVRPGPSRTEDSTKPRLRSKSGDDYRTQKWRNDDLFTKPKARVEDWAHRPRSKTNEHLPLWKSKDVFSKSDGAGVFRNPSSMAPGSLKMRRKHRPAPLIIPPHANMCGFQSRLRSPRIFPDGENGSKTAPVPYTPPPMLSPLRRGSGLFSSIHSSSSSTPQPLQSAGSVSTPRPSLLRSGMLCLKFQFCCLYII